MRVLGLALLALLTALAPGSADGRRGNAHLAAERPEEAAEAYAAGLARAAEQGLRAALLNNLGLAHFSGGRFAEADSAFTAALALAPDADRRARFAYHAGTAALHAGAFERAAERLREALVLRPADADARRNLELALRRQPPPNPAAPDPSPFARRVKAQADSLVAARRYADALELLSGALAQDSTVAAYAEYANRLAGVVGIEAEAEGRPPPPTPPFGVPPAPPEAPAPPLPPPLPPPPRLTV